MTGAGPAAAPARCHGEPRGAGTARGGADGLQGDPVRVRPLRREGRARLAGRDGWKGLPGELELGMCAVPASAGAHPRVLSS